jgi:sulfate transport system permease protein
VLIPLSAVFIRTTSLTWGEFCDAAFSEFALPAYKVTFLCSFSAALVNAFFGLILAWVLTRYPFPGRRIVDALVDLPFALPTAVAGISLSTIYSKNGWIGSWLEGRFGIQVAYSTLGIFVALTFIGLPFVVRTLQPVIEDLEPEIEEAAATLGASRLQTLFKVIIPQLVPAMLTGFTLAFARALGEYGSVIFISSNTPKVSQIAPLIIYQQLEQKNYPGATAVAVVLLVASFLLLLLINLLQKWSRRYQQGN